VRWKGRRMRGRGREESGEGRRGRKREKDTSLGRSDNKIPNYLY